LKGYLNTLSIASTAFEMLTLKPISLKPLVPRWLLIAIDINLFWIVLLLDPQGCYSIPVVIGGFHLPHRDLGISMGSWVAVEPSGMGLPSTLGSPKPFWAEPSYRASVSGALGIIASRGFSTPRSSRDILSSSSRLWVPEPLIAPLGMEGWVSR
jgi:hypothetical protein